MSFFVQNFVAPALVFLDGATTERVTWFLDGVSQQINKQEEIIFIAAEHSERNILNCYFGLQAVSWLTFF